MVHLYFPLVFSRNSVPGEPGKSFLHNVCSLRGCKRLLLAKSLVTGSARPPPLSCNKCRNDGPFIFPTCFYTKQRSKRAREILSSPRLLAPWVQTITVGRILGYRFGSSTSSTLQKVEKRWSIYLSHLFLHTTAFLVCPGNPFFTTFARSVGANDCCWQNPWTPVRLIHVL